MKSKFLAYFGQFPGNQCGEIRMSISLRSIILALTVPAFLGVVGLAIPQSAIADDAAPLAQTHEEAVKLPAGKFIQELGDKAIAVIADKDVTAEKRGDKFREILRNSFDLSTIGRFVIGRSWNSATPEQQKEYMHLFEELVVKSYGDRLTLYTGEGFRVTGVRSETERDYIINSQITHPDGSQPTAIDWRVRQRDGKLGVIDVVVEGVSLSVTQRQEYASVIQRSGGQIDGLLAQMRQQLQTSPTNTNQHG
jgi:phospholipid transport system substrate-binding protein